MSDPYHLQRFVDAQESGGTYLRAVEELRAGRKSSHWMWFVFPQLAGLGRSATAQLYALSGPGEARAYLDHPVLGPRLRECAGLLVEGSLTNATTILGATDALKLRSSATLFIVVAPEETVFATVLDKFFAAVGDEATLSRLPGSA